MPIYSSNFQILALNWLITSGDMQRFVDEGIADRRCFTSPYDEFFDVIMEYYNLYGKTPSHEYLVSRCPDYIRYDADDDLDPMIPELKKNFSYRGIVELKDFFEKDSKAIPEELIRNEEYSQILKLIFDKVSDVREEYEPVGDPILMMDSEVEHIETADPISYLDTGIEGVSLRSEDAFLSIIAGTGIGKTWVMCKIAVDLAKAGKKVLFVSEELPKRAVVERLYAYYRHVSISDVEKKLVKIVPDTGLQIGILDHSLARYTYVSDISAKLRTFKPDVVLIDDISYMSPDSVDTSKMQTYQRISEAIYQLIVLQHRSKIPFITTMQFNRSGGAAEIKTLYDVSGSVDSVTKAPTVILLDRKKDKKDTIFMIVDKERYGDDGKRILKYKVDYSTCTWTFDGYVTDEELSVDDICEKANSSRKVEYDWRNKRNYFTHQDVVNGEADSLDYIKGKYPDGKETSDNPEIVKNKLVRQFNFKPTNIY